MARNRKFISGVVPPAVRSGPAWWFVFQQSKLLVYQDASPINPPCLGDLGELGLTALSNHYLGRLDDRPCYAAEVPEGTIPPAGMTFEGLRRVYGSFGRRPVLDRSPGSANCGLGQDTPFLRPVWGSVEYENDGTSKRMSQMRFVLFSPSCPGDHCAYPARQRIASGPIPSLYARDVQRPCRICGTGRVSGGGGRAGGQGGGGDRGQGHQISWKSALAFPPFSHDWVYGEVRRR